MKHCREETSTARMSNLLTTAVRPDGAGTDGAFLWTENTSEGRFGLCYKETQMFSGVHSGFQADVLTFNGSRGLQSLVEGAEVGKCNFIIGDLSAGFACKDVSFEKKYYGDTRPTVLVSPEVLFTLDQETVTIVAHAEMASQSRVRICAMSTHPVDVLVTWAAVGIVDPCAGVICDYFGVCVDKGPHTFECVAPTCDSIDDPVCASNAVTYDNECEYHRFIFLTRQRHISIHHNGSCNGFLFQRGTVVAHHNSQSSVEYDCQTFVFNSRLFYPHKPVHALVTVDHRHANYASQYIHDAPVAWIDRLTSDSLTACVYVAGRGERHDVTDVSLNWLVYQGAPDGAMGGIVQLDEWWTGTTCEKVTLERAFSSPPLVLATLRHSVRDFKHDAASLWVEDIHTDSFSLCVRELQNFDGLHENVSITWLAVAEESKISRTIVSERGSVDFADQDLQPSRRHNYAFCKGVEFSHTYPSSPSVLVTPSHKTTISGNVPAVYNDIVAWIEQVTVSEFLICVAEIRVRSDSYDPLSVSYVVLPFVCPDGWFPRGVFCFKAFSRCQSWTAANSTCESENGSLASVHDQQEAYFVGALSPGKSWIGLHRDGKNFSWTDGTEVDFVHWAAGQPNHYKDSQNCVLEMSSENLYHWNDEQCGYCYPYVCRKDLDECETGTHDCAVEAACVNNEGSFSCECPNGYAGDGRKCTPNECVLGTHNCDGNAVCEDTEDGFTCTCKSGFFGDGTSCSVCSNGYSSFRQSCYKHFGTGKDWHESRAQCQADGGDLVSIANQDEYAFVQSLATSNIWLGYNDIAHEGTFVWSDGSPDTFRKWTGSEPNNLGDAENCVHTNGNGPAASWNDARCGNSFHFVCERPRP